MKTPGSTNSGSRTFETFFEGWLVRQEHYLEELQTTLQNCHESREDDLKDLISRVLAHYQEYYEEKSRMANRNVFLVFAPTWFSPFERTFFWIAGFKPSLAFRVVGSSVNDMTEDQTRRLNQLKDETRAEETELANELARIQESVAAPPIMEMARRFGSTVDGEVRNAEIALEAMRAGMEAVLANADMLRTRTAQKLLEILSPIQYVKFLLATTQLQLRVRMWGTQREAERRAAANRW